MSRLKAIERRQSAQPAGELSTDARSSDMVHRCPVYVGAATGGAWKAREFSSVADLTTAYFQGFVMGDVTPQGGGEFIAGAGVVDVPAAMVTGVTGTPSGWLNASASEWTVKDSATYQAIGYTTDGSAAIFMPRAGGGGGGSSETFIKGTLTVCTNITLTADGDDLVLTQTRATMRYWRWA